jgi:hypothetical protein
VTTTQRYTHLNIDDLKKAHASFHPKGDAAMAEKLWACEFCKATFPDQQAAEQHEKSCWMMKKAVARWIEKHLSGQQRKRIMNAQVEARAMEEIAGAQAPPLKKHSGRPGRPRKPRAQRAPAAPHDRSVDLDSLIRSQTTRARDR